MKRLIRRGSVPILSLLLFTAVPVMVAAQGMGSTPDATAVSTLSMDYPVAVHEGTCNDMTQKPAWDFDNATPIGENSDDAEAIGSHATNPILETSGTIDTKLDDLGETAYSLAIHASSDDYATIVACGEIGGAKVDGKLVIALAPVGKSLVTGVAIFDSDNSGVLGLGDEQTKVTVYVMPAVEEAATPAA
jgi:hypothetical protein